MALVNWEAFRCFLQELVNKPTEYKIKTAITYFNKLLPIIDRLFNKDGSNPNGATYFFGAVFADAVLADGKVAKEEYTLIRVLLNLDEKTPDASIFTFLKARTDHEIVKTLIHKIVGFGDHELHQDFLIFIATICAIDNIISAEEVALLHELFNA